MTIGELFLILTGCVLSSNYVLVHFFSADTVLSCDRLSLKNSVICSLYLGVILILSSILLYPVGKYLLSGAAFLRVLVSVVAILLVTAVVSLIAGKKSGELFSLSLSSSVLGAVLLYADNGYTLLQTVFAAVGTAVGYLLVTVALSCVREKVKQRYVPSAMRGYPVMMVALGIIALTVYAF